MHHHRLPARTFEPYPAPRRYGRGTGERGCSGSAQRQDGLHVLLLGGFSRLTQVICPSYIATPVDRVDRLYRRCLCSGLDRPDTGECLGCTQRLQPGLSPDNTICEAFRGVCHKQLFVAHQAAIKPRTARLCISPHLDAIPPPQGLVRPGVDLWLCLWPTALR